MNKGINTINILKGESLAQSILSDVATGAMLFTCIWFSHKTGCILWEFFCMGIFLFWLGCKLPFSSSRILRINSKREAIEWAHALADDGSTEQAGSPRMPAPEPWPDPCGCSRACDPGALGERGIECSRCGQVFPLSGPCAGGDAKAADETMLVLRPDRQLTQEQHNNLVGQLWEQIQLTAPGVKFVLLPSILQVVGGDMKDAIDKACQQSKDVLPDMRGDVLPAIDSSVLIHLGRSERWVKHTVVGYYVWKDHGGDDSLHRVFVRVKDSDGHLNARMLKDVRPVKAATPLHAVMCGACHSLGGSPQITVHRDTQRCTICQRTEGQILEMHGITEFKVDWSRVSERGKPGQWEQLGAQFIEQGGKVVKP